MKRHKEALEPIIGAEIEIQGSSDLTIERHKFSGNAQHRKRRFLLFHGTFLLHFDIELVESLLPLPSRCPAYRQNRPHKDFLRNLNIAPHIIKETLQKSWSATEPLENIPFERIDSLVTNKYSTGKWNFKF
jgi:lipoate-protein ligase A